jgi:hypothetical protein
MAAVTTAVGALTGLDALTTAVEPTPTAVEFDGWIALADGELASEHAKSPTARPASRCFKE